ncbi:VOC family protein [Myxococcota bacterium]|nr:VOC family protein [Myxococcota bacterium]MBU1382138.1 VOC family protein [Myxococcota bacterium]MBU1495927.1 VOC family protein [Myxococcota bacterium]
MKFGSPLIVVTDLNKSKQFYADVLGLEVILDFGENVTLTGGLALQTLESWLSFIHKENQDLTFGANTSEYYFEEIDFDTFIKKLRSIEGILYVHDLKEHAWGQRVIRFYDPDMHIIEVGEDMKAVVQRFLESGLTVEETATRMNVPLDFIKANS